MSVVFLIFLIVLAFVLVLKVVIFHPVIDGYSRDLEVLNSSCKNSLPTLLPTSSVARHTLYLRFIFLWSGSSPALPPAPSGIWFLLFATFHLYIASTDDKFWFWGMSDGEAVTAWGKVGDFGAASLQKLGFLGSLMLNLVQFVKQKFSMLSGSFVVY